MCGRYLLEDEAYADILQILYNLNKEKKAAAGGFSKDELVHDGLTTGEFARGEIFPTAIAPVCTSDGIVAVKWGFPHWKNSGVIINARAETASEKKMFSKSLREGRCVVPSSGFYEWNHGKGTPPNSDGGSGFNDRPTDKKSKQKDKYFFRRPEDNTLYMAGIAGTFRDALGTEYKAFAILTTAANDSVSQIHDRMPVILAPDELQHWIDDDDFSQYILHRPGPELVSKLINETAESYYENILN